MRYLRRSAFLRLVVLPFTLSLWLSACTSYVAMQGPYAQTIVSEEPGKVRAWLDDGSRVTISRPRIEADSLVGFVYDARTRSYTDTVRVALGEVSVVEREKADILKGIGVGFLILTAVSAIAYAAECASDDSFFC